MIFELKDIGETVRERREEFADAGELSPNGLFIAGADAKKEIGLGQKGETEGVVIDTRRELVLPGEDGGASEAGAFGGRLKICDLFGDCTPGLGVPIRPEIGKQVIG